MFSWLGTIIAVNAPWLTQVVATAAEGASAGEPARYAVENHGRIDAGQGDHVECEIPGRVPGVLPLVRHREDVVVPQVPPVVIAPRES